MMQFNNEVVMVSYYDFPFYAGISKRIEGLLYTLTHFGISAHILCPLFHRDKPSCANEDLYKIEYIDLRWLKALMGNSKPVKFLAALIFSFFAFLRIARKSKQCHCIIQYQTIYSALPAILAKIFLKATVIGDDIGLLHTHKQPPRFWILRAVDMSVLKFTDIIITFSSIDYTFIKRKFESKHVLRIPNGVIVSPIGPQKRVRQTGILLFVGSLTFDHNLIAVDYISKIAERLIKKRKDFQILIVGGPLNKVSHLMNHSLVRRGTVKFLGYVPGEILNGIFASAHIGLLPFFYDTPHFGQRTKALEYFVNGLLVISGQEGVKGIHGLKPGKHYLLANSLDEMGTIVDKCLSEPERYRDIAAAGAGYISENYSWETLTEEYISLFQSFASEKAT